MCPGPNSGLSKGSVLQVLQGRRSIRTGNCQYPKKTGGQTSETSEMMFVRMYSTRSGARSFRSHRGSPCGHFLILGTGHSGRPYLTVPWPVMHVLGHALSSSATGAHEALGRLAPGRDARDCRQGDDFAHGAQFVAIP